MRHPIKSAPRLPVSAIGCLSIAALSLACGGARMSPGGPVSDGTQAPPGAEPDEQARIDVSLACGPAEKLADLPAELAEASGIVRDPLRPELYWLHNDSGNPPVLFAVDTTGALRGSARLTGTLLLDAEDLALARCNDGWCLYVGDVGDNFAQRSTVLVHRVVLPELPAGDNEIDLAVDETFVLRYPDGADDVESLVIDSERGELLLFTKGRRGTSVLLATTLEELEAADGSPVTLRSMGTVPVEIEGSSQWLTAADLSPDGNWLALRSYESLHIFPWAGAEAFDSGQPPATTALGTPPEPQGEGIGFAADGRTLYLASEARAGENQRLSRISCSSASKTE
ncbi:MAG: hypothetical protein V3U67_08060 [Gemmatimonadota bacterium]